MCIGVGKGGMESGGAGWGLWATLAQDSSGAACVALGQTSWVVGLAAGAMTVWPYVKNVPSVVATHYKCCSSCLAL
jgi:hypothetical protein